MCSSPTSSEAAPTEGRSNLALSEKGGRESTEGDPTYTRPVALAPPLRSPSISSTLTHVSHFVSETTSSRFFAIQRPPQLGRSPTEFAAPVISPKGSPFEPSRHLDTHDRSARTCVAMPADSQPRSGNRPQGQSNSEFWSLLFVTLQLTQYQQTTAASLRAPPVPPPAHLAALQVCAGLLMVIPLRKLTLAQLRDNRIHSSSPLKQEVGRLAAPRTATALPTALAMAQAMAPTMEAVTAVVTELAASGIQLFQGQTHLGIRLLAKALADPAACTLSSLHQTHRISVLSSTTTQMALRTGALPMGCALLAATSGEHKLAYNPLASFRQPGATALALANSAPKNVLFQCQRTSPQPASSQQCWPRFYGFH